MKLSIKSDWPAIAAFLLSLPSAYFIFIAVLKYELNINGPFDSAAPFLERVGISEPLGFNINLLILFGPLAGFLLAMIAVLSIDWQFTPSLVKFHFTIHRKWFALLTALFSGCLLAFLGIYFIGENCRC